MSWDIRRAADRMRCPQRLTAAFLRSSHAFVAQFAVARATRTTVNRETCATMLPECEGRKRRWLTVARPKETGALVSDVRVAIQHEGDIVIARQKGRELAASRGFSSTRGATFYFTLD